MYQFPISYLFPRIYYDLCVNHRKLGMATSWLDHIFNHSHQINELIGTLLFNNDIADNFDIDFDKCTLNCQFHTEMSWKYEKNLDNIIEQYEMVVCYQNCSDLLWKKNVPVIEKKLED